MHSTLVQTSKKDTFRVLQGHKEGTQGQPIESLNHTGDTLPLRGLHRIGKKATGT